MVSINPKTVTEEVSVDAVKAVRLVLQGSPFPIKILMPGTPTYKMLGIKSLAKMPQKRLKLALAGFRECYVLPSVTAHLKDVKQTTESTNGTRKSEFYQASLDILKKQFVGDILYGIESVLEQYQYNEVRVPPPSVSCLMTEELARLMATEDGRNFINFAALQMCIDGERIVEAIRNWGAIDALEQRTAWTKKPGDRFFDPRRDYARLTLPKLSS